MHTLRYLTKKIQNRKHVWIMLKWVVRVMVEHMALSLKIPLGFGGEAKATSNLNLFDDLIIDLVASIDLLPFECEYYKVCKVHKKNSGNFGNKGMYSLFHNCNHICGEMY
jgi:hypothetical protein